MTTGSGANESLTVARGHQTWQVHAAGRLVADELDVTLDGIAAEGGGPTYVWVHAPTTEDDAVARAAGLELGRDLHEMRVTLPLADQRTPDLPTRAFEPGADDDAWLAVNNRAFAWHPEQGGWTHEQLAERMREPWFDADDFRLHERDGRLAGFCWTKVHPHASDETPGEIYVIAVDPDFSGLGLGRALTVAGLRWLHDEHGITTGMLYVDASNTPAVHLYRDLGFTLHHVDRAYHREVAPRP
jgi:mycothiol synthase